MDVQKLKALGWTAKTTLQEGVKIAYGDYLKKRINL
jgi:nucleoside-diphosphate-sugar epimerase